ncbi:MAG: 3-deoxy-8-phosphooctulonate synthase [Prevotellaceae bacterium]|jgi:2-dehydro-3-deoxyphosphooctonate aldolase (KDO 8-P synthase)|nr:3-deoxy-8-phosphooctulonate synthase [Prevotellaceae bacterium]
MTPQLSNIRHGDAGHFFLMAGPCVVESEKLCMDVAAHLAKLSDKFRIPYIFKASYRKANRSRGDSFTGIGDEAALEILRKVRCTFDIPVVTDIHSPDEAQLAARYDIDVLQIPAFLSRQTDLLTAAAQTGKVVNIKKGQFLAPEAMRFAVDKVKQYNPNVMLTERGTQFGYYDLVVDFRGIVDMKQTGVPVVLDVTHSLQQPNQQSGVTGGKPALIETLAKAGIAVGVDGLFLETHPHPAEALSDGANMLPLDEMESLLRHLLPLHRAARLGESSSKQ